MVCSVTVTEYGSGQLNSNETNLSPHAWHVVVCIPLVSPLSCVLRLMFVWCVSRLVCTCLLVYVEFVSRLMRRIVVGTRKGIDQMEVIVGVRKGTSHSENNQRNYRPNGT